MYVITTANKPRLFSHTIPFARPNKSINNPNRAERLLKKGTHTHSHTERKRYDFKGKNAQKKKKTLLEILNILATFKRNTFQIRSI